MDFVSLQGELVDVLKNFRDEGGDPNGPVGKFLKTVEAEFSKGIREGLSLKVLEEKLKLLYHYEKSYLSLVQEFKEEIKFASTIQEDLRKERSNFFAQTLKEVSATLKDSQVSDTVASRWIEELVSSYTKSLKLSGNLVDEHTIDTIGELRKGAKEEAKELDMRGNSNKQDAKNDK